MNRDDDLGPLLRPWMRRHAADAPLDLLDRVMREVDTMSERTTTRSWLSWFSSSPVAGWGLAAAAVTALAIAILVFTVRPAGPPTGAPASLTPTPRPTAAPTSTPTPGLTSAQLSVVVDVLLTRWWNADAGSVWEDGVWSMYAEGAEFRSALSSPDWDLRIVGRDAIAEHVGAVGWRQERVFRTGELLRQGEMLAFPATFESPDGAGNAIVILQVQDGLVLRHYVIGAESAAVDPTGNAAPSEVVDLLEGQLIALQSGTDTIGTYFTPDGELRDMIVEGTPDAPALRSGRADISAHGLGFWTLVLRTGSMLQAGPFVVYPCEISSSDTVDAFMVLELDADNLVANEWVIGTAGSAPAFHTVD